MYVPKTPLHFHTRTPEGYIAEIYEGNPEPYGNVETWKPTLASSLLSLGAANYMLTAA